MSPIVQRLVKFAQQARTLSTRYLHAAARPSVSEIETLHEKLSDTVTPLWRLPYSEQLKKKYDQNYRVLQALTRAASKNKSHKSGQLICPLEDVVPSVMITLESHSIHHSYKLFCFSQSSLNTETRKSFM